MTSRPKQLKNIIMGLVCLMCCYSDYAQENKLLFQNLTVDTVLEKKTDILAKLANSICNSNPDSSLLLSRKTLNMAIAAKSSYEYALAFGNIGWAYFKLGNIDSTLWYTLSASTMFHDLHKTEMESRMLLHMSSVYESISDYPNSIRYVTMSMKLANINKDSIAIMLAEKMMGVIYMREESYEKSKLHLDISAKIAATSKNKKDLGDVITCQANLYLTLKLYDTAKILYHHAIDVYESANDLTGIAMVNESLGTLYFYLSDLQPYPSLDSSLAYYQHAYSMNIQLNNVHDAAIEKISISQILIREKQYGQAEKNLKESLPIFDSTKDFSDEYFSYKLLSILYDSIRDYKKAYLSILKANIYYDTLNKQEKNQAIADMLVKYEANKKDTTIALLNARSELAERKLSKTRIIEIFSFILIALSVLLTLVLLNRNNIKQRFKQLQMRNQIASDLHDEVGSSLSSILMLGKMASVEKNGKDEIINKINSNAAEMIERISDIVWATNPKYDDGKNLNEKISNYIMQINQLPKITINLNIGSEVAGIKFQMDIRRNVFLIIKEAINNILKHANAEIIVIDIHSSQKKLLLNVTDNGNGFDTLHSNDGNGLENMQARAESVGGNFSLTSIQGKGTKISIVIPL